ncbi:hypothetical protein [Saccharopolyspora tripterygii]
MVDSDHAPDRRNLDPAKTRPDSAPPGEKHRECLERAVPALIEAGWRIDFITEVTARGVAVHEVDR